MPVRSLESEGSIDSTGRGTRGNLSKAEVTPSMSLEELAAEAAGFPPPATPSPTASLQATSGVTSGSSHRWPSLGQMTSTGTRSIMKAENLAKTCPTSFRSGAIALGKTYFKRCNLYFQPFLSELLVGDGICRMRDRLMLLVNLRSCIQPSFGILTLSRHCLHFSIFKEARTIIISRHVHKYSSILISSGSPDSLVGLNHVAIFQQLTCRQ